MHVLDWVSWVVVDERGEHDPVHTFNLLRQQELNREAPNMGARLCDLSFDSICKLLAVDAQTAAHEAYGALLPSETMMRLQNEEQWEQVKSSLANEVSSKGSKTRPVVKIGLMEQLEELAGDIVIGEYY
ncbi:hypothetical protein PT974_06960 [Cladobotryum mycophilum]|uniref:Uncharacterized protein n=1 Tax=Cladobotryum mycophilum TaxID=491253 RepID=A0ABR0SN57_9HYPO